VFKLFNYTHIYIYIYNILLIAANDHEEIDGNLLSDRILESSQYELSYLL